MWRVGPNYAKVKKRIYWIEIRVEIVGGVPEGRNKDLEKVEDL